MTLLISGLVVFFGIHFIPASPLRGALTSRFGEGGYKGLFSLAALAGLLMIIFGFRASEFQPLWPPLSFGRGTTIMLMPIAAILVVAANMPNNIKRFVRHPMLIGIALWGALHLSANGDLASTLIFTSFLTFSIIDILLVETAGRYQAPAKVPFFWDLAVIALGVGLYTVLFMFHRYIAGIPLVSAT